MIFIGQDQLSLEDFSAVLFEKKEIAFTDESLKTVDENFRFLKSFSANKLIYASIQVLGRWRNTK